MPGRGSRSGGASPISSRCVRAITSRWSRRAAQLPRWGRRRASRPTRSLPCSRSACPNTTVAIVFMPLPEAQLYFNRAGDVTAIEVYTNNPDRIDGLPQARHRRSAASDLHDRLAPAQRDVLQCAAGRAQRDVSDPDADRPGRSAEHHLRPDHAGEGQGQRHRDHAHHGRDARLGHAHLPHHGRRRSAWSEHSRDSCSA